MGNAGTIDGWSLTITPRICAQTSLTATKTGPDYVEPGQALTYTLTITNSGGLPLDDVIITETYDANTLFYGANPPPTSGNDVWNLGQLGVGSTRRITVTVQVIPTVADQTVLTNTLRIQADQISPFSVTKTSLVVHFPQFNVAKRVNPNPPRSWHPFTYTLTVSNSGDGDATGIVIADTLPAGANYVSGGSYESGTVTWSGLTLPASDTLDVTVVVTACGGTLVNSAYRVQNCDVGINSPWGTPLTTTVQAPNLVADFVPTSGSAQLPATVSFTAIGTTDGGPITAWGWNFGDGESGVGRVVSHTYTSIGDYTVTLT
ncbi:MAG: DUF11 domain-containing protein, partial [bacterium]|nr:DUF11 domain-containing protein [bacterium]